MAALRLTVATSWSQALVVVSDRLLSQFCPVSATVWWLRRAVLEETDYLRDLGAAEVIDRRTISDLGEQPIANERWDGAVDSVGSHRLANVMKQTQYRNVVAACGLAQAFD